MASAVAFVAAGYFGRGVPAVLSAVAAAVAAVVWIVLVDPLIWDSNLIELVPPTTSEDCDPGCISVEAAVPAAAIGAAFLAGLGILLRRAVGRVRAT